jgi:hypothetical protein
MDKIPLIHTLKKEKHFTKMQEESIFEIVLKKCIEEINTTHKFSKQTYIIFNVPKIIIEYLNYNQSECLYYLVKQFKKKNYKVEVLSKNQIYIDWSEYQIVKQKPRPSLTDHTEKLSKLFPKAKLEYQYQ